ncbi:MAG: PstS family phosphate ABC transporter substrate-binding protein [Chloroflexota bacterium]|nr:PstS family phosphate ABC transporter substrate-binding protein [Chloroflexota bacterium]
MSFVQNAGCVWSVAILILGVCLAGCSPQTGPGSGSGEWEGTITVSGAFALYPMMIRWGEEYGKLHPDVTFDISAGGAGKGMADALTGAVDIGMVSRPIFDAEIEKGAFWVPVAKDAVVVTVNAQNPVLDQLLARGLTRDIAEGIWISEQITDWAQVVGGEGGEAIHVYTRADACGAAQTWAEYLGDYSQEDLQGVAVQADPGLAEAVSKDVLAIGYNNLNFAYDANTGRPLAGMQILPLDVDANGEIDPHERFYETKADLMQAISEGRYPSPPSRALNLVTRGKPEGTIKPFLEWVMTGGQQYLDEVGYVPVSQEQLEEGLAKLQ